ncbi:hypothetical protein ACVBEF_00265 [Glaciimonas sp. GG7]
MFSATRPNTLPIPSRQCNTVTSSTGPIGPTTREASTLAAGLANASNTFLIAQTNKSYQFDVEKDATSDANKQAPSLNFCLKHTDLAEKPDNADNTVHFDDLIRHKAISLETLQRTPTVKPAYYQDDPYSEKALQQFEKNKVFKVPMATLAFLTGKETDELNSISDLTQNSKLTADDIVKFLKYNQYYGKPIPFVVHKSDLSKSGREITTDMTESPDIQVYDYLLKNTVRDPTKALELPLLYVKEGIGNIAVVQAWIPKYIYSNGNKIENHEKIMKCKLINFEDNDVIDHSRAHAMYILRDCEQVNLYDTGIRFPPLEY